MVAGREIAGYDDDHKWRLLRAADAQEWLRCFLFVQFLDNGKFFVGFESSAKFLQETREAVVRVVAGGVDANGLFVLVDCLGVAIFLLIQNAEVDVREMRIFLAGLRPSAAWRWRRHSASFHLHVT